MRKTESGGGGRGTSTKGREKYVPYGSKVIYAQQFAVKSNGYLEKVTARKK